MAATLVNDPLYKAVRLLVFFGFFCACVSLKFRKDYNLDGRRRTTDKTLPAARASLRRATGRGDPATQEVRHPKKEAIVHHLQQITFFFLNGKGRKDECNGPVR